jgi:hypothetical protein
MTHATTRPQAPRRALRAHTEHLLGHFPDGPEPIGTMTLRLVLVDPDSTTDSGAWVITHPLGNLAGATHTEVALVDASAAGLPEPAVDDLVRQVAGIAYGPGRWAFHYRPELVPDRVLRHGSLLRERIEVSAVEVWA